MDRRRDVDEGFVDRHGLQVVRVRHKDRVELERELLISRRQSGHNRGTVSSPTNLSNSYGMVRTVGHSVRACCRLLYSRQSPALNNELIAYLIPFLMPNLRAS